MARVVAVTRAEPWPTVVSAKETMKSPPPHTIVILTSSHVAVTNYYYFFLIPDHVYTLPKLISYFLTSYNMPHTHTHTQFAVTYIFC
jgi:hypothetical protein